MDAREHAIRQVVARQNPFTDCSNLAIHRQGIRRLLWQTSRRSWWRKGCYWVTLVAFIVWQVFASLVGGAWGLSLALTITALWLGSTYIILRPDLLELNWSYLLQPSGRGLIVGVLATIGLFILPYFLLGWPLTFCVRALLPGRRFWLRQQIQAQLPATYEDDPDLLLGQVLARPIGSFCPYWLAKGLTIPVRLIGMLTAGLATLVLLWLGVALTIYFWRVGTWGWVVAGYLSLAILGLVYKAWRPFWAGQSITILCAALLEGQSFGSALSQAQEEFWAQVLDE
jgi:hypothetical protein